MKTAIAVFLLFLAVFFLWYDFFWGAVVCFVIAAYLFVKKPADTLAKDVMQEMESAEGQVPDKSVWEDGLKEMGARVGEKTFSDYEEPTRLKARSSTRFKFKPEKVGEASKKTIGLFKKLFG